MTKMPHFSLDELEEMIENSATELGWRPQDLMPRLQIIADHYIETIERYRKAQMRAAILHPLKEILQEPDKSLPALVANLPVAAIQAIMGIFPNRLAHYTDINSHDHVAWVANDDTVMNAIFKSQMALRSQRGDPSLVRVELNQVGFGIFDPGDEDTFQSCLVSIAEVDPVQIWELTRNTINSLTDVFESSSGLNRSLLDGVRANADWQLYNLFLDEIWPIESGQVYSNKMRHLRDILNAVMMYVWGSKKPKHAKGNKVRDKNDDTESEGYYHFDEALFSTVLTLRHQINSLNRALEIVGRRFAEIEASRDSFENPGIYLNALDRLALYPLRDWMNELKRRLEFGDYRPHVQEVRRPTGEVMQTPRMPKLKMTATEYERMHALIEAAAPLVRGKRDVAEENRLIMQAFSPI